MSQNPNNIDENVQNLFLFVTGFDTHPLLFKSCATIIDPSSYVKKRCINSVEFEEKCLEC